MCGEHVDQIGWMRVQNTHSISIVIVCHEIIMCLSFGQRTRIIRINMIPMFFVVVALFRFAYKNKHVIMAQRNIVVLNENKSEKEQLRMTLSDVR